MMELTNGAPLAAAAAAPATTRTTLLTEATMTDVPEKEPKGAHGEASLE